MSSSFVDAREPIEVEKEGQTVQAVCWVRALYGPSEQIRHDLAYLSAVSEYVPMGQGEHTTLPASFRGGREGEG